MSEARRELSIAPDVIGEIVDGEAVVLDLRNGVYFALNGVGTRIWELIGQHGVPTLVRSQILEEFDVAPSQLDADLERWLSELKARGLVIAEKR